mmetsp:Transcript_85606/g.266188  ORF Transcript_85606/g.266188 Transcript_85606/m.266188 type:complete len:215 (-) Transcript_85606:204-848(-)
MTRYDDVGKLVNVLRDVQPRRRPWRPGCRRQPHAGQVGACRACFLALDLQQNCTRVLDAGVVEGHRARAEAQALGPVPATQGNSEARRAFKGEALQHELVDTERVAGQALQEVVGLHPHAERRQRRVHYRERAVQLLHRRRRAENLDLQRVLRQAAAVPQSPLQHLGPAGGVVTLRVRRRAVTRAHASWAAQVLRVRRAGGAPCWGQAAGAAAR